MTVQNSLSIYLHLKEKNKKPAIELRKLTSNPDIMKAIITSAITGKPIIVMPTFLDRMRALAVLAEKKIIKYDYDKSTYSFLI